MHFRPVLPRIPLVPPDLHRPRSPQPGLRRAIPQEFDNLASQPDARAQAVIMKVQPVLRSKACGETPTTPFNPARL